MALVYDESMTSWTAGELIRAVVGIPVALALAFVVQWLVRRVPWPARRLRLRFALIHLRFALIHLAAATACVLVWFSITSGIVILSTGRGMEGGRSELVLIGGYFYAVVAGVAYAVHGSARAAQAEAAAAQMQLAALRAQIQPHFLFNALHTVVQLIPVDPARATEAAELVADLLRTTMEEQRDMISLADEWAFVSRYLEVERIRFGDRLRVTAAVDPDLLDARVPSFALQTLVENAVRHGAAPRIAPTDIVVTATGTQSEVRLSVRNNANGASTNRVADGAGTGLKRLRERLAALHGSAARLTYGQRDDGDFEAVLVVPRERASE
jgi:two-component system, LytTR family, sensor kinase